MSSNDTPKPESKQDDNVETITEGKATIIFDKGNSVFYNKVQEFNRDLSILVITEFAKMRQAERKERRAKKLARRVLEAKKKGVAPEAMHPEGPSGLRVLEALSATGLRSIRYWKEVEEGLLDEILVNDFDEKAVDAIKRNFKHNNVPMDKCIPNLGDACDVMYSNRCLSKSHEQDRGFDVIDLDPYGTAANFLDGAVQSVRDGGLLCVTCTDKAVLCGKNSETCYGKYGATSIRAGYCHEMAVRIVLQSIEHAANKYKRYIIPLVSMSIDFYVRVFVRVKTSPLNVKSASSKMALVYQSNGCDAFYLQPLGTIDTSGKNPRYSLGTGPPCDRKCQFTGSRLKVGGPIYSAPMHDKDFVGTLLNHVKSHPKKFGTEKRILGQLNVVDSEIDAPLYYKHMDLGRTFHTPVKLNKLRSAIINAGYQVSQSHSHPSAVKTTAPPDVIMDIMKQFVLDNPEDGKAKRGPTSAAGKMMAQPITTKADFTVVKGSEGVHSAFLPNPEENWGPKARAKGNGKRDGKRKLTAQERSKENQGKRSRKAETAVGDKKE